jgi:hypothetical protein
MQTGMVIVPQDGLHTGVTPFGVLAAAGSDSTTSAVASTAKNTVSLVLILVLPLVFRLLQV